MAVCWIAVPRDCPDVDEVFKKALILTLTFFFLILETTPDPRNVMVTELQLSDISDDVGTCWREVGPKLHISSSKIHNLDDEYRCN